MNKLKTLITATSVVILSLMSGCEKTDNVLKTTVDKYCSVPTEARMVLRKYVNVKLAPLSVVVSCQNDTIEGVIVGDAVGDIVVASEYTQLAQSLFTRSKAVAAAYCSLAPEARLLNRDRLEQVLTPNKISISCGD